MLSRAAAVTAELQAAYQNYQFARFYQVLMSRDITSERCCAVGTAAHEQVLQRPSLKFCDFDRVQHLHAVFKCSSQAVQRFAVTELSNFYLDVAKDRLYVRGTSSTDRRSASRKLEASFMLRSGRSCVYLERVLTALAMRLLSRQTNYC